jgi:hypothetical protein
MSRRTDFLELVTYVLRGNVDTRIGLAVLRDAQLVPEEKIPARIDLDQVAWEFVEWRMEAFVPKPIRRDPHPEWIQELVEHTAEARQVEEEA